MLLRLSCLYRHPVTDQVHQFTVRRVVATEAAVAIHILREAAAWAAARGSGVWTLDELDTATFVAAAHAQELVIGYTDATPAATMLLQVEDRIYWPESPAGIALYVHKVAVRRAFAGQGWLGRMIEFASEEASALGIHRLRLDTVLRPK